MINESKTAKVVTINQTAKLSIEPPKLNVCSNNDELEGTLSPSREVWCNETQSKTSLNSYQRASNH